MVSSSTIKILAIKSTLFILFVSCLCGSAMVTRSLAGLRRWARLGCVQSALRLCAVKPEPSLNRFLCRALWLCKTVQKTIFLAVAYAAPFIDHSDFNHLGFFLRFYRNGGLKGEASLAFVSKLTKTCTSRCASPATFVSLLKHYYSEIATGWLRETI